VPQVKFLTALLENVLPKDKSRKVGWKGGAAAAAAAAAAEQEPREEFFEGLGNIAEAPKYLRIKGKVCCCLPRSFSCHVT
jgi:hypothetical protein